MASRYKRPPSFKGSHCDDLINSKSKQQASDMKAAAEANWISPIQCASRLLKQMKRAKEATKSAIRSSRKLGQEIGTRSRIFTTSDLLIQFRANKLPVQVNSLLQLVVILVPILMNSSAICLCYQSPRPNGLQLSANAPDTYLMDASELEPRPHQTIRFSGPVGQLDDDWIGPDSLQTPVGQPVDWAQRLRPASNSLIPTQQHDQLEGHWPPNDGQIVGRSKFIGQNGTQMNQIVQQPQPQQQQQGPLSRAIEATKMFVKQQHQQLAAAANTAAALTNNHQQPVVVAPIDSAPRMFANEPQVQMFPASPANGSQVASRLYNFLFQPKGQLLSTALSQSLAEVKRKMSQQQQPYETTGPMRAAQILTSANQEPFQLASSEGNSQHSLGGVGAGRGAARSAREHRTLVTLSAPYEQQQAASAAASHSNLLPAASGQHQVAAASELTRTSDQWQQTNGKEVDATDELDEQSNVDPARGQLQIEQQQQLSEVEHSGELSSPEAGQDESGDQRHLVGPEQNTSQWSANSFVNQQEEPEEQIELQRQQQQSPQDQLIKSQDQSGEDQERQQQQVVMVSGGEAYEQQPISEQDNKLLMQPQSNSTATYVNTADQFETMAMAVNETGATPDEQQPEDDGKVEQGASLQGDESLVAVQLPSQYESAIGIPPEGHYDDYFKPLGAASLHEQAATTSSFTTRDLASPGQNGTIAGNSSARSQQLQPDFAYQYFLNQQQRANTTQQTGSGPLDGQKVVVLRSIDSSNGSYYQTLGGGGGQFAANISQNSRESNNSAGDQFQIFMNHNGGDQSVLANATGSVANASEDGVQLIVANSQDQLQDPNSNEKLITYTSENGQDSFARLVGKPARQTFFNKDLNESPTTPASPNFSGTRSPLGQMAIARQPMGQGAANRRTTRSPSLVLLPSNSTAIPPKRTTDETIPNAGGNTELESYEILGPELNQESDRPEHQHQQQQQQQQQQQGQFGQYAAQSSLSNRNDRQRNLANGSQATNKKTKRLSNQKEQVTAPRKRPHFDSSASRQQQTVRRPQVTEAKFQLKDLPLNAPTSSPSLDASSAVKSLAEIPNKAKRLRDNQADKNELMSELLAALDRVKAAIYKLQPLTAKMNAIYRKSVTSNTRDQILDNHKGTYAKRYPPGDYDDSYDRMHPSELIERQRGSSSRSASGPNATSATSRAAKTAAMERRADGRNQFRTILVEGDDSGLDSEQPQTAEQFQASDSKTSAIYLPAPRKMLDEMRANQTESGSMRKASELPAVSGGIKIGMSQASFVRRQGGIVYDDEGDQVRGHSGDQLTRRAGDLSSGVKPNGETMDEQSPLFGYRITIYQSPSDGGESSSPQGQEMAPDDSKEKEILTYSLIDDGRGQPIEFSSVNESGSESINWPTFDSRPSDWESDSEQDLKSNSKGDGDSQLDSMATSESSLVPHVDDDDQDLEQEDQEDSKQMVGSESENQMREISEMKKKKKKGEKMEEAKGHKKKKKAKGHKEGEKHSKQQHKGKKGQEEHKKKKEFKKIKHHKGLMSKESHKLHRDKHIKAHDRGAAKEKALKERTQIEFFEREQIVDDEFEKGKKSTVKAGWATGHDSKKSSSEIGGKPEHADSMSMGGSHQLGHLVEPTSNLQPAAAASSLAPMMMDSAASNENHHHIGKGKSHSMSSSSGKQSNKFEKKHMEAKGKKFKGWREKGYKIITETEFIDRGSLHDSAYKKRDKGAAHHQKFKKHESKSEGHQGSMHEMHKKSHKKEEKQHKSEEKKKEMMGKEEAAGKEAKKSAKKSGKESKEMEKHKKSSKHSDHDQEESALSLFATNRMQPTERPTLSALNQTKTLNQMQQDRVERADFARAKQSTTSTRALVEPKEPIGRIRSISLATNKTVGSSQNERTGPAPSRSTEARQQDPANNLRSRAFRQIDHVDDRPTKHLSNSSSNPSNAVQPTPHAPISREVTKIGLAKSLPSATLSNVTLIDMINRLNVSRSDSRAVSELRHINATANERRYEQLSPLVRLVNSLARLNQSQSLIKAFAPAPEGRESTTSGQQQHQSVMNKVQFDEQIPVQRPIKQWQEQRNPNQNGQIMLSGGNNLHEFSGENRLPLSVSDVLMGPVANQPQYISSPSLVSDGQWTFNGGRTLPNVQQQYFLQDSGLFEPNQRRDEQQKQRLVFNGQQEPTLNLMGPNFMADFEQSPASLTNVATADYHQQQVAGLLLGPQTLAQMQQHLQQFSFLTD